MKQVECVQLRAATIGIPSAGVRLRTADGPEKISRSGYSSARSKRNNPKALECTVFSILVPGPPARRGPETGNFLKEY